MRTLMHHLRTRIMCEAEVPASGGGLARIAVPQYLMHPFIHMESSTHRNGIRKNRSGKRTRMTAQTY